VQSDVDERVCASRKELEAEIKSRVCEASRIAERALEHAHAARTAGAPAVNAALARLKAAEREISGLLASK
jgi:hypothetical protein